MCIFLREFLPNIGLTSLRPVSMLIYIYEKKEKIENFLWKILIKVCQEILTKYRSHVARTSIHVNLRNFQKKRQFLLKN